MIYELFNEVLANNFSKADNDSLLPSCDLIQIVNSETLTISIVDPITLKTPLKLKDGTPGPYGITSIL